MIRATVAYRPRSTRSLAISEGGSASFSACADSAGIERLQVERTEYHEPVLVDEIVSLYADHPTGVFIDATLGGGGHSARLLAAYPTLRIIGIDRDPAARAQAGKVLAPFGDRVRIVAATFGDIVEVVATSRVWMGEDQVVGVLMDLGVSSHQLDEGERGFSFRAEAPLDMRMDPTSGLTAAQYLATADVHDFTRLLRENGEDRFAGAIARSVLKSLPQTTSELSAAVERVVPMAVRRKGHVATRVFQALRIAVNDEMGQLQTGLNGALEVLDTSGILTVISYHSGEDRTVKTTFHRWATGGCQCPQALGCVCGAVAVATVDRASSQLATTDEISHNPRARSARLRIARKVTS